MKNTMNDTYLVNAHSDDYATEWEEMEAAKEEVAAKGQKKEDFFFFWSRLTEAMLGF